MDGGEAPLWVFGYGSLMWRPGFPFDLRRPARLADHRRAFCLRSVRWRGTPEAPGLVLGLAAEPGAECRGIAYRVPPERVAETRAYLHEREMGTYSYHERFVALEVDGHGPAEALAYVMDTAHPGYVRLPIEAQAEIILRAAGPAGPNRDYLHATVLHLRELGVSDPELEALDRLVRRLAGEPLEEETRP